jgi:hypothetical protein
VQQVVRGITGAGRRPVLLTTYRAALIPYGTGAREILLLHTRQDEASESTPPEITNRVNFEIWMLEPTP